MTRGGARARRTALAALLLAALAAIALVLFYLVEERELRTHHGEAPAAKAPAAKAEARGPRESEPSTG